MAKITFLGLGNMGKPMALRLLQAGHKLTVFDLVPERINNIVAAGAIAADTIPNAAKNAEFVISMLPTGADVSSLYLGAEESGVEGGAEGLLPRLNKGTMIIDCSTIDAQTTITLASAAKNYGVEVMDAPVSGGVAGATAGTLAFLCGGTEESFAKAKPILQAMGQHIFHAGNNGAGQLAKMCNNMLLSILMVGTSEALTLGVANGLDPSVLSEIMQASSGRNWALELYNPYPGVMPNSPASNDYQPGFTVDLMCKDLKLASAAATESKVTTPLGSLAQQLFSNHQDNGFGSKDFSSILRALDLS